MFVALDLPEAARGELAAWRIVTVVTARAGSRQAKLRRENVELLAGGAPPLPTARGDWEIARRWVEISTASRVPVASLS